MYLAASASGSGAGTVTYTGTTVTDTGAAFGTIPAGTTVRAMAVKCASTITSITSVDVTDTASDFVALGVSRGDILRTGTTWAVVSSVVSTSTLRVEQWIDSATYEQAPVPAVSASFTVYGLVRGTVQSNTSTVLTVRAWRNWDGTLVTPAAGTLYEVTVNVDYSGVFVVGSGKVRVTNNTFRRTWADAITALTSTDIVVSGNTISDTQDVGVTIGLPDSTYSTNRFTVADNVMNHIGSAGIWVGSATDGTITGNVINEAGWSQDQATASYGGIMIQFGSRLAVSNNIVRRVNQPGAVHAIHVFQSGAAGYTKPTNIAFNDNQTFGYGSGGRFDLRISGGGVAGWVTGMTGRFQADSVIAVADSADPPTGTFRGAGAPAVPAGVGSTYLRSDGGAGSTLYVKESGTGTSGWIAK
jgi:parallel beta-helix repeat protein